MIFIIGKHNWCKKNLAFYMYVSTFPIFVYIDHCDPVASSNAERKKSF